MKVLFLCRSLDCGGAEQQLVALALGLHKEGWIVSVAVLYSSGALEHELEEAGVPVIHIKKRGRWDVFGFLFRLIRVVSKERPVILHGYLTVQNVLLGALKPLFPPIHMVWGVRASYVDLTRYNWLISVSYWLECQLSRFADLIIVNSRAGFGYALAHGVHKGKLVVIPNGIDTERFRQDGAARKRIRGEWGIKDHEKLIGIVARFDPMKDHPTFLRAAAMLARHRDDVRFVCVGGGPTDYRCELEALATELGLQDALVWAGVRSDMPAVFNALDLAVSSSRGEGFSNVIGEAMACGVPNVVTDVGDSAWIVGDTCCVASPQDPKALEQGMRDLLRRLDGDRLALGKAVRARVVNEFCQERLVQRTTKVLESLVR